MTQLLVSVRNAEEALSALSGGADLIDIKEPGRGPLGAADPCAVAEVVEAVGGKVPVSVALGELRERLATPEHEDTKTQRRGDIQEENETTTRSADRWNGVSYAKLGMAGMAVRRDWAVAWRSLLARLPATTGRVAVAYADWTTVFAPPPEEILREGIAAGCAALLVDTYSKSGPGLLGLWNDKQLERFVAQVREARLLVVLGGGLTEESLDRVLTCQPDYVAVRGAACRGGRRGKLQCDLVRRLRARLSQREGFT